MFLEKLFIGGNLLLAAGTCTASQDDPTAIRVERWAIAGASDLFTTADLAETDFQIPRIIVISH